MSGLAEDAPTPILDRLGDNTEPRIGEYCSGESTVRWDARGFVLEREEGEATTIPVEELSSLQLSAELEDPIFAALSGRPGWVPVDVFERPPVAWLRLELRDRAGRRIALRSRAEAAALEGLPPATTHEPAAVVPLQTALEVARAAMFMAELGRQAPASAQSRDNELPERLETPPRVMWWPWWLLAAGGFGSGMFLLRARLDTMLYVGLPWLAGVALWRRLRARPWTLIRGRGGGAQCVAVAERWLFGRWLRVWSILDHSQERKVEIMPFAHWLIVAHRGKIAVFAADSRQVLKAQLQAASLESVEVRYNRFTLRIAGSGSHPREPTRGERLMSRATGHFLGELVLVGAMTAVAVLLIGSLNLPRFSWGVAW